MRIEKLETPPVFDMCVLIAATICATMMVYDNDVGQPVIADEPQPTLAIPPPEAPLQPIVQDSFYEAPQVDGPVGEMVAESSPADDEPEVTLVGQSAIPVTGEVRVADSPPAPAPPPTPPAPQPQQPTPPPVSNECCGTPPTLTTQSTRRYMVPQTVCRTRLVPQTTCETEMVAVDVPEVRSQIAIAPQTTTQTIVEQRSVPTIVQQPPTIVQQAPVTSFSIPAPTTRIETYTAPQTTCQTTCIPQTHCYESPGMRSYGGYCMPQTGSYGGYSMPQTGSHCTGPGCYGGSTGGVTDLGGQFRTRDHWPIKGFREDFPDKFKQVGNKTIIRDRERRFDLRRDRVRARRGLL